MCGRYSVMCFEIVNVLDADFFEFRIGAPIQQQQALKNELNLPTTTLDQVDDKYGKELLAAASS